MRVANLPWYDYPESAAGLDRFWACVRDALRALGQTDVPETLTRSDDVQGQWADPGLLLSQCCGPDLFTTAGAGLEPIARPAFAELDATAGHYFSHVVGRLPSRGALRIVVNATSSRSGHGALRDWLAEQGLEIGAVTVSGSHAASIDTLRRGEADVAAIDAHNWRWLETEGLDVIGRSAEAPSPPWVVHRDAGANPDRLREALVRAVDVAGPAIGIVGVEPADRALYAPFARATRSG